MKRGTKIAAFAGLVAVALGVALWAGIGRPEQANGQTAGPAETLGITVNGLGSVEAVPDQAEFSFGVETQATTSDEALDANSAAVAKVIDALEAAGVDESDIQTQQVSVYPRYSEDGQNIVGFTATNTVSATITDLSRVGTVVDAAVTAGANVVYGPSLSIADSDALYQQALAAALDDGRAKAEAIAKAAGVSVGEVVNIVESGGAPPPMPFAVAEEAAADVAVPIEPGTQEIMASLNITYAIS